MGVLDRWLRRDAGGVRVRCGMCGRVATFPPKERDRFVAHSCDSDLLVRDLEDASDVEVALDLFVRCYGDGAQEDAERDAVRDRLMYEVGEGPIPALEELLFVLKYQPRAPFPPPALAKRWPDGESKPRIDWSNELEMILHRIKEYAITRRQMDEAAPGARPILADKLARLRTEPLEPIED